MRDVLTTTDVRQITGWCLPTIRRLIKQKKLPAKDISSGKRRAVYSIRRADLEAFLSPESAPNQGQ